jgi:hypothetical protein
MSDSPFAARRAAFRKLHERGCFAIPHPWDAGTARHLGHLGFQALATTSAGLAFSCAQTLAHIAEIVASVDLPVNADFESGFAHQPRGVFSCRPSRPVSGSAPPPSGIRRSGSRCPLRARCPDARRHWRTGGRLGGARHTARAIAAEGSFAGFDDTVPYAELNGCFRDDLARRTSR